MDHHSSGCLPAEKFPTFASGRQGREPVSLLSFRSLFPLTRRHDVALFECAAWVRKIGHQKSALLTL
jgi:hypothetical protein